MQPQPAKVRRAPQTEKPTPPLTPERRQQLALKGQALYYKYCGLHGQGIYAESFAEYHLLRGEGEVVEDLAAFLRGRLQQADKYQAYTESPLAKLQALLSDGESA